MKQAVMTKPGEIEIRDVPVPEPGPGEALLRIERIGVCGSDVHVYHGKHPYTSYPVVQGHEFSAVVETLGSGVSHLKPGMRVTAMPQIVCGECDPCRRGDYHICDQLRVQGFQAPGCAQNLFSTAADKVIPLPDGFTAEQGAMVEPVSVAVHAVRRATAVPGRNVAVLGAGPIGNLVAQVARAEGAKVLITDLSDYRLDVARRCGLSATSNPQQEALREAARRCFGDRGVELVFECVGVEATVTEAVETLAKGGQLVVVGVFAEKPRIDLGLVQDRELELRGTLMYKREDYERAIQLMSEQQVVTKPLETRHFALADYAAAYRFIDQQRDHSLKVFIDVAD